MNQPSTNQHNDTDWDLDQLDNALSSFEGVVEGGTDVATEDNNCEGGACKI